eukprot:4453688-Amphidinium_carterae.1
MHLQRRWSLAGELEQGLEEVEVLLEPEPLGRSLLEEEVRALLAPWRPADPSSAPQSLFVMPWLATPFLRSVLSVEPFVVRPPTVVEPPAMLMVPAPVVHDPLPSAGLPSHGWVKRT